MIESVLNKLKNNLNDQLVGMVDLKNENTHAIVEVVTDTFKNSLFEKFTSGSPGNIAGLFGNRGMDNSMEASLMLHVSTGLASKFGISEKISSNVAKFCVPFLIDNISKFLKAEGKNNQQGISELMDGLASSAIKNKLIGGLGKKLDFRFNK